jgi:hypothetical protein
MVRQEIYGYLLTHWARPVTFPAGAGEPVVHLSVLGIYFPAIPSGVLRNKDCLGEGVQLAEVNIGEDW